MVHPLQRLYRCPGYLPLPLSPCNRLRVERLSLRRQPTTGSKAGACASAHRRQVLVMLLIWQLTSTPAQDSGGEERFALPRKWRKRRSVGSGTPR